MEMELCPQAEESASNWNHDHALEVVRGWGLQNWGKPEWPVVILGVG